MLITLQRMPTLHLKILGKRSVLQPVKLDDQTKQMLPTTADGWYTQPFYHAESNLVQKSIVNFNEDLSFENEKLVNWKPFNIKTSLSAEKVSRPVVGSSQNKTGGSVNTFSIHRVNNILLFK